MTGRREPRDPLDVRTIAPALELPGGRVLTIEPRVRYRASLELHGFGEPDPLSAIVDHDFELIIHPDEATLAMRDADATLAGGGAAADWATVTAPYALPHYPEALSAERLLVAHLSIDEFSRAMCEAVAGGRWFEWLDQHVDGGTGALEFAAAVGDEFVEDPTALGLELPMLDGSLYWVRSLSVHPRFRGRQLGAALLAHALWALRRATGDLAVLEAYPIRSKFDATAPRPFPRVVRQLVRYYERVGFRRSYPARRILARPVVMHLQFGLWRLPVRGLPGLDLRDEDTPPP